MKTNYPPRTELRSAITQLQGVARKKRVASQHKGQAKTLLVQEVGQLTEALRLLRWISE